ncbi:MAG: hypothetical protein HUU49_04845 [Candidatus Buchananbacteria bacterium]|nr:hypothetical protein [Candidatus Buchananbacteria bacterium]
MLQKTFFIALVLTLVFHGVGVLAAGTPIGEQMGGGLNTAIDEVYGRDVTVDQTTFNSGLITIINTLLTFTGIIFLLLIIYAGYLWMTARGNEEQVDRAKKITREVVIGLLLILLARIITEYILIQIGKATN